MKVTSYEQACELLNLNPTEIKPNFSMVPERHRLAMEKHFEMVIIAQAINRDENTGQDWNPNWDDYSERKYFPWFDLEKDEEVNPSGFRFFDTYFVYTHSYSTGGSRLCFKTSEDAKYAAETFIDHYRAMMVID